MSDHYWGAQDFRWDRLDAAISYIESNLVKWGRINVRQAKEKFGGARVYCSLGYVWGIYGLWNPQEVYFRWPEWAKPLAYNQTLCKILSRLIGRWQIYVYREVYRRAVAKYPDLAKEILGPADFSELLDGLMPEGYIFPCSLCGKRSPWLRHVWKEQRYECYQYGGECAKRREVANDFAS